MPRKRPAPPSPPPPPGPPPPSRKRPPGGGGGGGGGAPGGGGGGGSSPAEVMTGKTHSNKFLWGLFDHDEPELAHKGGTPADLPGGIAIGTPGRRFLSPEEIALSEHDAEFGQTSDGYQYRRGHDFGDNPDLFDSQWYDNPLFQMDEEVYGPGLGDSWRTGGVLTDGEQAIAGRDFNEFEFVEQNPNATGDELAYYNEWSGRRTHDPATGEVSWDGTPGSGPTFSQFLKNKQLSSGGASATGGLGGSGSSEGDPGQLVADAVNETIGEGSDFMKNWTDFTDSTTANVQSVMDRLGVLENQPQGMDPALMMALLNGSDEEDDSGNLFMSGVF